MEFSGIRGSLCEVGEPPKKPQKVCAVCQIPSRKFCSACHQVFYCSVEHQKSHWNVHKKDCSPIRIVISPELGPHFVATTNIPAGTTLLTELPVLFSPYIKSEVSSDILTCISCRSILPSAPWNCSQCSTPLFCNQACSNVPPNLTIIIEKDKIHSEFECGILSKCSVKQRNRLCLMTNLGYLRALHLKNSDSVAWSKVLKLRGANQYKPEDRTENAKWFIREILPLFGENGVGFETDMVMLRGIIQQSAIVVYPNGNCPEEDHGKTCLLYLEACNFVHNCFPNCTKIFDKGPQFQLKIRTNVDIQKGTILSFDFMDSSFMKGVMLRKHKLYDINIRGALCICPRCTDQTGTELGTMLSAVKCTQPNCQDGYLLPLNVNDMSMKALWRCNRSRCKGKGSTWGKIKKLLTTINLEIITFRESIPLADFEKTSKFLESLKKKLHPNHYLVLKLERMLVYELHSQIQDNENIGFTIPRLDLHISMIEHLLRMVEIMNPGLSLIRAYYLTVLSYGLTITLSEIQVEQGSVQRERIERTIEVIDTILPISKYYPNIWTTSATQDLRESRRNLQMALNSFSSTMRLLK